MSNQNPMQKGPPAPGGQGMPVGAPALPTPFVDGSASIPFSVFYQVTGGDKAKAEELVPGITAPDGHMMLEAGNGGKPVVKLKTIDAMAKFDMLLKQAQARRAALAPGHAGGSRVPQWIPSNPSALDENTYPGIGDRDGYLPYLRQDPRTGQQLMLNPAHPEGQRIIQENLERVRKARAVAGDQ